MAINGLLNQFVETFRKLSMLQRVSLLAATVAVFATVVVLIIWANRPIYKTLYADLPEQDASAITEALGGKNIPYRLVNGNTVEVRSDDVYSTRIALALEGLPRVQTTGFELFDETKMGMTEFNQNVNYQRALEGELARSIMAIDEIIEAKVHISIPKDRIFMQDEDESKASVVVRVLPGRTLRPDQVRAVSHLVASAVRGLEPSQVQIIDTNGNLLSEFLTETQEGLFMTQNQLEQQRQMERDIERKLNGLLATTLGAGNFVARASIEMDFNKRETTSEKFDDTPVLRSQYELEITDNSRGSGPAGIPGVESNLAEPDLLVDGIMREYTKTETIQNFEISRTTTHESKSSGEIRRLTVSVVVNDRPEQVEENGSRSIVRQPRTDEELNRIRTAVASAVGYNASRGDVVDVTNISFDISGEWMETTEEEKAKVLEYVNIGVKYLAAIIILLLFYLLLVKPILKRLDNAQEIDDELLGENAIDAQLSGLDIAVGSESGFPKTIEELEREIESELDESVPVDIEAVKSKVMLKKIEESANEDPEMVANLVKALIKGG